MKTNQQFDEAWRELHDARRSEDIHAVVTAIWHLQIAARLLKSAQEEEEHLLSHFATQAVPPSKQNAGPYI